MDAGEQQNFAVTLRRKIFLPLLIILASFLVSDLDAQFSLDVSSEEFGSYCDTLVLDVRIKNETNQSLADINLDLLFDYDISYLSNTFGFTISENNARSLSFDVAEDQTCEILSGQILVVPECNEALQQLEVDISLKQNTNCLSSTRFITLIESVFLSVNFQDYIYDASVSTLTKTISISNTSRVPISEWDLAIGADQNFAKLIESDFGVIKEGTTFDTLSLSSSDLRAAGFGSGSLQTGESIDIILVYELLSCDVRSVQYNTVFPCAINNCSTEQVFVDENEQYRSELIVVVEDPRQEYGICGPISNRIVIKHRPTEFSTSLSAAYNLKFSYDIGEFSWPAYHPNIEYRIFIDDLFYPRQIEDFTYAYDFRSLGFGPVGSLKDLEGDGVYNDLAFGDSLVFDVRLEVKENQTSNLIQANGGGTNIIEYDNFCGQRFSSQQGFNNPSATTSINPYMSVSNLTINNLMTDDSGRKFLNEKDSLDLLLSAFNSENLSEICNTDSLILSVLLPSYLRLDEDKEVYILSTTTNFDEDGNLEIIISDSIEVNYTIKGDSMVIPFLPLADRRTTDFRISAVAQCDITDNTNYDASFDFCDQCIVHDDARVMAYLQKPCDLSCGEILPIATRISGKFHTKCEELTENSAKINADSIYIRRITSGYTDVNLTQKLNLQEKPNSANHKLFFDQDTILFQVPFSFACQDALESFTIKGEELFGNPVGNLTINILDSKITQLDPNSAEEVGGCIANFFTNSDERSFSVTLDQTAYNLGCLDENRNHIWEVTAIVEFETFTSNSVVTNENTIRFTIDEVLKNGCSERYILGTKSIFANEIFREDLFFKQWRHGPSNQQSIFEEVTGFLDLFVNSRFSDSLDVEYRFLPRFENLILDVPQGYIIKDDEIRLIGFSETIGFFEFLTSVDTLYSKIATVTINDNVSQYNFDLADMPHFPLLANSFLRLEYTLQKDCQNPSSDTNTSSVSIRGDLAFLDLNATNQGIGIFEFEDQELFIFNDFNFSVEDDFQILTNEQETSWIFRDQRDFSNFAIFSSRSNLDADEEGYYIQFESTKSTIDSISIDTGSNIINFLFFDSLAYANIETEFISDNLIRISNPTIATTFFELDTVQLPFSDYIFHTSNHDCGFDTLVYRFGPVRLFEDQECTILPFQDTLVTFRPSGFPEVRWDTIPNVLFIDQLNSIKFSLQNIAQGSLQNHSFSIAGTPNATHQIFVIEEDGSKTDLSSAINISQDSITFNLSAPQYNLNGISATGVDHINFEWQISNICPESPTISPIIQASSFNFCNEELSSPSQKIPFLPISSQEVLDYSIRAQSYAGNFCGDTLGLRIFVENLTGTNQLENEKVQLIIPSDLSYIQNSSLLNENVIGDPQFSKQDEFTVLSWDVKLDFTTGPVQILELFLSGACISVCRQDRVKTFMQSELVENCNAVQTAIPLVRAFSDWQNVLWRPTYSIQNITSSIENTGTDDINVALSYQLDFSSSISYEASIFIDFFIDTNQNNFLDNGEEIITRVTHSKEEIDELNGSMMAQLNLSKTELCFVKLKGGFSTNCYCELPRADLLVENAIVSETILSSCTNDNFAIPFTVSQSCQGTWRTNPRLDLSNPNLPIYINALGTLDTVFYDVNCGACQIEERYIIDPSGLGASLDITQEANCIQGATASVSLSSTNSNLTYTWSHDQNISSNSASDIPPGMLNVIVSDGMCADTLMAEITAPDAINFTLDQTQENCNSNFAIDITAMDGSAPYTILWNDGRVDFTRTINVNTSYYFTITDQNNCTANDSIFIDDSSSFVLEVEAEDATCDGIADGNIRIINPDLASYEYSISGPDGYQSIDEFQNLSEGQYTVLRRSAEDCIDSVSVMIGFLKIITTSINHNITAGLGETIALNPNENETPNLTFEWSGPTNLSCTACPNPTLLLTEETQVFYVATDLDGCMIIDSIIISIVASEAFYIPNVFSPNGDGTNDLFFPFGNSSFAQIQSFLVFDRWGNTVYHRENIPIQDFFQGWNGDFAGKQADIGIYGYRVKFEKFNGEFVDVVGDVLLVR